MSEDAQIPPTSIGLPFTQDTLVAVFDERAPAERACEALLATGFAEDAVSLLAPQEVNADLDERDRRRTPLQKAVASARDTLEEEGADAQDVAGEAAAGHWILRAHVPEQRQRDQAAALLKRYGAHDMTFYARWTREELR